jgi:hypothetical protein
MDLILCMAGIYRRFREAGYTTPKFLLPWRGATVLEHILDELRATSSESGNAFRRVLFIANERDRAHAGALTAILAARGLDPAGLTFIPDTRGQAETALIGLDRRDALGGGDGPLAFHNVDTVISNRDWLAVARRLRGGPGGGLDGWIDTFPADSAAYSYVALDAGGLVTAIAEKRVISPHATTGFYAFASAATYRAAAARAQAAGNEFYISDVYAALLSAGGRIGAGGPATAAATTILGTPAEYEAAVRAVAR